MVLGSTINIRDTYDTDHCGNYENAFLAMSTHMGPRGPLRTPQQIKSKYKILIFKEIRLKWFPVMCEGSNVTLNFCHPSV